jgi:putative OPT family oligopeptide transporter
MSILRLFDDKNILECNAVQTCASAGGSLAAGVIYSLPALVIFTEDDSLSADGWTNFLGINYVTVTSVCLLGGLLGVLFSIPIRRALISETEISPPLRFPEGIATANVLIQGDKSAEENAEGFKCLAWGASIGGLFQFLNQGLVAVDSIVTFGGWFGESPVQIQIASDPISLAIGYIVGWKIGVVLFLGGVTQFCLCVPIAAAVLDNSNIPSRANAEYTTAATYIFQEYTRFVGVGCMLVGAIWVLISIRHSMRSAVAAGVASFRKGLTHVVSNPEGEQNPLTPPTMGAGTPVKRTDCDLPMHIILCAIGVALVPLYILFSLFTGSWGFAVVLTLFALIFGFVFSIVSAYMAGLVGASTNPISGVTVATILMASVLIRLAYGGGETEGPTTAIVVGGVVCCAAAIGQDNMQDLKCGYIVGATPLQQQKMQMIGVTVSSFVMAPVLEILRIAYGFGNAAEGQLPAPQATLMATVADGVINGGLPWTFLGVGCALSVLIIGLDQTLAAKHANFRVPILAFAVGTYLPMGVNCAILIGSIAQEMATRRVQQEKDRRGHLASAARATEEQINLNKTGENESSSMVVTSPYEVDIDSDSDTSNPGLLYAAGLLTGAGLMGLLVAFVIIIYTLFSDVDASDANPIARATNLDATSNTFFSVCQLAIIVYTMFRFGVRNAKPRDLVDTSPDTGSVDNLGSLNSLISQE